MLEKIIKALALLKDADGDSNPTGTFALPMTQQEMKDLLAVLTRPDTTEAKAALARLTG